VINYLKLTNKLTVVIILSILSGVILLSPSFYLLIVYNKILTFQNINSLVTLTIIYIIVIFLGYAVDNLRANTTAVSGKKFIQQLNKFVLNKYPNVENWNASKILQLDTFLQSPYIFYQFDLLFGSLYILLLYLFAPFLSLYAAISCIILFFTIRIGARKINSEKPNHSTYGSWSFFHAIGLKELLTKDINKPLTLKKMNSIFEKNIVVNKIKYLKFILVSGSLAVSSYLVINNALNPGVMFMVLVLMSRILAPAELYATGFDIIQIHERYLKQLCLDKDFNDRENTLEKQNVEKLVIKDIKIIDLQLMFDPRKEFQKKQFQLNKGKSYLIIGPNGSGKTTFLNTLLGTMNPKNGQIIYNDIKSNNFPSNLRHQNFNYMPQGNILSPISIKDYLLSESGIEIKSLEIMVQHLGLMPKILSFKDQWNTPLDEIIQTCSPGEVQKLKLIQSTLTNKAWNFFDEPDHFLDGRGVKILINHFSEIKKENNSIILVSHKPNMMEFFDEIIVIDQFLIQPPIPKEEFLKKIKFINNSKAKK
jgi:ATP-binding cassette subfamily C exporter for protease/lipase